MRKWKVKLKFENGMTNFTSFTLVDVGTFIKDSRVKNNGRKKHRSVPINRWLISMVFDKAIHTHPIAELVSATILQEGSKVY